MWKTLSVLLFLFLLVVFWGLKKLEENPSVQQVTGLSSLARTECIPVRCKAFCRSLTQWRVVLLLEVGLFGLCQLHTMHPYIRAVSLLTGTLISGLTWKEQAWHFPPDHIPGWTSHHGSSTSGRIGIEKKNLCLVSKVELEKRSGILGVLYFQALNRIQPIIYQRQHQR